jgi:hypothetical protein
MVTALAVNSTGAELAVCTRAGMLHRLSLTEEEEVKTDSGSLSFVARRSWKVSSAVH